jgi:hypothetical protein
MNTRSYKQKRIYSSWSNIPTNQLWLLAGGQKSNKKTPLQASKIEKIGLASR